MREQIGQHARRVAALVQVYGHGQVAGHEVTRWYRDEDDIVVCVSRPSRLERRPLGPEADTTGVLDGVDTHVSTDRMLSDPTRSVARIAREVARHELALAGAGRRADAYAVNVVRQALMTLAATLADQVGRPDVVRPSVRESLRRAADACLAADERLAGAVVIPTSMAVAPTAAAGRSAGSTWRPWPPSWSGCSATTTPRRPPITNPPPNRSDAMPLKVRATRRRLNDMTLVAVRQTLTTLVRMLSHCNTVEWGRTLVELREHLDALEAREWTDLVAQAARAEKVGDMHTYVFAREMGDEDGRVPTGEQVAAAAAAGAAVRSAEENPR